MLLVIERPVNKILAFFVTMTKVEMAITQTKVNVKLNIETFTVKMFDEKILKGALYMVAPDAEIEVKGVLLSRD
jgi:hypothetical protein